MDQEKSGRLIAALRKERGMTQRVLAEHLGVTDRAVSKWENGRGLPEKDLLAPLANILGISVEEILTGERRRETAQEEEAELRIAYEKLLGQKNRRRHAGRLLLLFLAVCILLTGGILLCNRTFLHTDYRAESAENIRIAIPRFSFFRSEGGVETHLVKLKTLRQTDEIEVFITAYLAGFERVDGESGTYYYHAGKDFTIWQYAANNDGIGFINTIYIGYADGYYQGTI